MSRLDDVMNSIDEESTETVQETNKEEVSTTTPSNEENESTEPENGQENDSTESPTEKKDKSAYSDIEKAEYSFRKQLGKQKQKYESLMAEQKKEFEALQARLDKLENPDKYKEKLRSSFETDDEYIDYLVQQRMNKVFDEQNQKQLKERELEEKEEAFRSTIDTNIKKCFETEDAQKDYYETVKGALDAGLEKLMDSEKYCAEYILKNPNGPIILYNLAKDKGMVKQIFSQTDPMSRLFELKMYERELLTKPKDKGIQNSPNLQKPIGKPGISKESTADMFSSKDELRNFIRRR